MSKFYDVRLRVWGSRQQLLRRLLSLLALGAFGWIWAACDVGASDCKRPSDCFGGEICVSGQCTPAAPSSDVENLDAEDPHAPDIDTSDCDAADDCQPCEPGFHLCGDVCVDDTSVDTCGARCEPCPAGTQFGSEATCEPDGTCGLSCEGDACPSCEEHEDCTEDPDKTVCFDGACVQCTADSRWACVAKSCDPIDNTCTDTTLRTRRNCQSCVADNECKDSQSRCVPMKFMGDALPDRYCLPLKLDAACIPPYPTTVQRTAASASASQPYCSPNESNTTCDAILDQNMPCQQNSQCGKRGYEDGLCKFKKCTFTCDTNEDCFFGDSCHGLYCGSN